MQTATIKLHSVEAATCDSTSLCWCLQQSTTDAPFHPPELTHMTPEPARVAKRSRGPAGAPLEPHNFTLKVTSCARGPLFILVFTIQPINKSVRARVWGGDWCTKLAVSQTFVSSMEGKSRQRSTETRTTRLHCGYAGATHTHIQLQR